MDFLKTLLVYLTVTMATGVQQGPPVEDVPIPTATPYVEVQQEEENTSALQVELPETPAPPTATPNPNPTITPNKAYKNVAYGDNGSAVKKLQRRLIELGYLPEKSDDGKFGYQTLNAVRAFQEKNGLAKDGVAGAATLTHLYQDPDVVPAVTPTIAPTDTPEPPVPSEAPVEISAPEAIAPPEAETPETPDEAEVPETPAEAEESAASADVEAPEASDEIAEPEAPDEPATPAEPAAEDAADVSVPAAHADDEGPVEGPIPGLIQVTDGTIALGESGAPLAALRLSDGVMRPFYPRVWQNEAGEAVLSLRDLADCISGWTLEIGEDDEPAYTLTAAGYTLTFTVADAAITCAVDGAPVTLDPTDVQTDGADLYITEHFLREALKASALWDEDEHTLMLTVPEKEQAEARD